MDNLIIHRNVCCGLKKSLPSHVTVVSYRQIRKRRVTLQTAHGAQEQFASILLYLINHKEIWCRMNTEFEIFSSMFPTPNMIYVLLLHNNQGQ